MSKAVIIDAIRTPMGRHGGILKEIRPDDLAAFLIRKLVERTGINQDEIEDVYLGCTNQAGEDSRNIGRNAALLAGLPYTVPGTTVNRLCGSGLEAINQVQRAIEAGDGDLFIAGGVENMTRSPWVMGKNAVPFKQGNVTAYDSTLGWRFPNPSLGELYPLNSNGVTAENIAEKYKINREDQDTFALESHQWAIRAHEQGLLKHEIIPVEVPQHKGPAIIHDKDEGPRPDTSLEKLKALKSVFKENGTVTAGNSSPLSDGAAVLLMASEDRARSLGLKPLVRILSSAVAGVHPSYFGIGPVPATQKALTRAQLTIDQLDRIEINEAFASQSLACIRELGIDRKNVNVHGGAIALGHPLGCSGARIMTTLVHELTRQRHRYGLATLCIGVGQGISTIVERVD